jgi:Ca2+-binding EF-hand superfamily protein
VGREDDGGEHEQRVTPRVANNMPACLLDTEGDVDEFEVQIKPLVACSDEMSCSADETLTSDGVATHAPESREKSDSKGVSSEKVIMQLRSEKVDVPLQTLVVDCDGSSMTEKRQACMNSSSACANSDESGRALFLAGDQSQLHSETLQLKCDGFEKALPRTHVEQVIKSFSMDLAKQPASKCISQAHEAFASEGAVTMDEALAILDAAQISGLFSGADAVKLEDFLGAMCTAKSLGTVPLAGNDADICLSTFEVFDRDNDGFLNALEMREVLNAWGEQHDDDSLARRMNDADLDGDGRLSYAEFERMMMSVEGPRLADTLWQNS